MNEERFVLICSDCGIVFERDSKTIDQCEKCRDMSIEAEAWHISDFDGCYDK